MASGISNQRRIDMLKWLTGQTVTAPSAFQVALWIGDPGDDGQSNAEVGGGLGYARDTTHLPTTTSGWSVPSGTTTVTTDNVQLIAFGTASSAWTGVTHVALFVSGSTAANFIARFAITGGAVTVNSGATVTIAIGALDLSMTFT